MVNCAGESVKFGDQCYKVQYEEKHTAEQGGMRCTYMGGDLASIASQSQHDFIVNLVQKQGIKSDYFIGKRVYSYCILANPIPTLRWQPEKLAEKLVTTVKYSPQMIDSTVHAE